jgi:hypothetical protein
MQPTGVSFVLRACSACVCVSKISGMYWGKGGYHGQRGAHVGDWVGFRHS